MKTQYLIAIGTILLTVNGCKKDRLKDDKAILIGEWEWVYTDKDNFGTLPAYELFTPNSEGKTYQVEYSKKGIIKMKENNDCRERKRTVFTRWRNNADGSISFSIRLNNNQDDQIGGLLLTSDTLAFLDRFPYSEANDCNNGCNYTHYFVKN